MPEERTNESMQCLVLAPRHNGLRDKPVEGLRSHGLALREVHDAPSAMVALAEHRYAIVVFIDPGAVADADALAEAVDRYHHRTRLWQFIEIDGGHLCPFRPRSRPTRSVSELTSTSAHAQNLPPESEAEIHIATKPAELRSPDLQQAMSEMIDPTESSTTSVTLSMEELELLLGDPMPTRGDRRK